MAADKDLRAGRDSTGEIGGRRGVPFCAGSSGSDAVGTAGCLGGGVLGEACAGTGALGAPLPVAGGLGTACSGSGAFPAAAACGGGLAKAALTGGGMPVAGLATWVDGSPPSPPGRS